MLCQGKTNLKFMPVLLQSIENLEVHYYLGKYFSLSTVEQSALSSKVALRYKSKHQVSRAVISCELFRSHVDWKHNSMH